MFFYLKSRKKHLAPVRVEESYRCLSEGKGEKAVLAIWKGGQVSRAGPGE